MNRVRRDRWALLGLFFLSFFNTCMYYFHATIKTKRAFDDFQIDQNLLQSITRKTRIDSWKNQEYSTKVDRVRKPMHRCIEDQTLKGGIFLVFGQT